MNIIQRAASNIFRLTLPYASAGTNIDDISNIGWTPITYSNKSLPEWQQDKMFQISAYLYRRNPIAHRIVEVIKAFIIGEGIYIKSDNPEVDAVIQKFWNSKRNNWRELLRKRVASLSVFGEALWPAYVDPTMGQVIMGNASPLIIDNVLPNARNNFEAEYIITKKASGHDFSKLNDLTDLSNFGANYFPMIEIPPKALKVIKLDTQLDSDSFDYLNGDVFFFTINSILDDLRGLSDIYTIGDWLDIYDKFLFNRAEKQLYMNQWLWDITLEGATKKQQEDWLATQLLLEKKQQSGRMFVHNEKIKRQPLSPNLNADDASKDAHAFMQMIWGGSGFSSQAFGDPGGFGRESANDMNEWVFRTLLDRQVIVRNMLLSVLEFVIHQAILHKTIKDDKLKDTSIQIFMPKISVRDLQRITQSLRNLGNFISQAFRNSTMFEFQEKDKVRIREIVQYLLDHIDLNSSPDVLVDPITQNSVSPELVKSNGSKNNGSKNV